MYPLKDWKAKLERAHFLKVQSDKIPVCNTYCTLAVIFFHTDSNSTDFNVARFFTARKWLGQKIGGGGREGH